MIKPYDENAVCPKCGCDRINAKWRETSVIEGGDYMLRTCDRCRYGWMERPLDYAKETDDQKDTD